MSVGPGRGTDRRYGDVWCVCRIGLIGIRARIDGSDGTGSICRCAQLCRVIDVGRICAGERRVDKSGCAHTCSRVDVGHCLTIRLRHNIIVGRKGSDRNGIHR